MENNEKKIKYDLTVLLKDDDPSFVEEHIKNAGGTDLKTNITKVDFAYDVKDLPQGYMAVIHFILDSYSTPALLKKLRTDNNVLRHMLLRDIVKKEKGNGKTQTRRPSKLTSKPSKFEEHLTNEAIEQKIEEILD